MTRRKMDPATRTAIAQAAARALGARTEPADSPALATALQRHKTSTLAHCQKMSDAVLLIMSCNNGNRQDYAQYISQLNTETLIQMAAGLARLQAVVLDTVAEPRYAPCHACNGTGKGILEDMRCPECMGAGQRRL